MGGLFKVIIGAAIGVGVGYALAKRSEVEAETDPLFSVAGDSAPTGLKARLQEAGIAGQVARAVREAELQAHFRQRVHDPQAFTSQEPGGTV